MEKSVFEYDDYKAYVVERIDASPGGGRGLRRRIAEAIGCQVAYVSHVLAGDRHFSLEQAEALCRFFALRTDEAEFLLLLVEYNRAGTTELRGFLQRQLNRRRMDYQQLKNRVRIKGQISADDQATYYSSWHYQAVRMLLTIPGYRTPAAIARKLEISPERVNEILSFFIEKGLAKESDKGYVATETQIHLSADSPLISRLHTNWRIHTLKSLDRKNSEDYHYSGAVTLSHQDYAKVREVMVKTLLECHNIIRPSKEERLCVLAMDFYEL